MSNDYPGGGEALRAYALEIVRQALTEAGHDPDRALALQLLDLIERYDLPLSSAVLWIHGQPTAQPISTGEFHAHCRAIRGA